MTTVSHGQSGIINTERGLIIAGTRITLCDVMDYVKAQYPHKLAFYCGYYKSIARIRSSNIKNNK